MMRPDLDKRTVQPEAIQRHVSIVLTRDLFPIESIGNSLFPAVLEGRMRPETVLSRQLTEILPQGRLHQKLTQFNITIGDLLTLPSEELASLDKGLIERVRVYLEGLAVTPHAKLLEAAFGQQQSPIPPEREEELIRAVDDAVATLKEPTDWKAKPIRRQALILHFGLHDGIPRSWSEVARILVVSPGNLNNSIGREALGLVRDKEELKDYLVLPADAVFKRDILPSTRQAVKKLDDNSEDEVFVRSRRSRQYHYDLPIHSSPPEEIRTSVPAIGTESNRTLTDAERVHRDYLREQRKPMDQREITKAREVITRAVSQGRNSPEEIHEWVIERGERIFRTLSPQSWTTRAIIEYILRHPEVEY